ncbi:hypothetical protein [Paractinoplanes globisporus]|uniref:Secreted protein n=1 Tax=Paractinoplanes globisporus TaxID=113565 RepID=A0ABW6WUT8_9ACTN|nr:hypothetical protein [Actinoplanes globisporus]
MRKNAILSLAGLAVLLSALLIGSPAAEASVPPEPDGWATVSTVDSVSPKTVVALCPPGQRVTGGGGWAFATTPAENTGVAVTHLEPVHFQAGDGLLATATEIAPGIPGDWWLEAYAFCAEE